MNTTHTIDAAQCLHFYAYKIAYDPRHPFSEQELRELVAAAGLFDSTEPRAKDQFVVRINALKTLREGLMLAEHSLMADLYKGPYPDTASESGAVEHAAH